MELIAERGQVEFKHQWVGIYRQDFNSLKVLQKEVKSVSIRPDNGEGSGDCMSAWDYEDWSWKMAVHVHSREIELAEQNSEISESKRIAILDLHDCLVY